jgi:hypothetical protein
VESLPISTKGLSRQAKAKVKAKVKIFVDYGGSINKLIEDEPYKQLFIANIHS